MSQVFRARTPGRAKVDAHLLTELDWFLDMDLAASRSDVSAMARQIRDGDGSDAELNCAGTVHDYLDVFEVEAVQRLRGWIRLRHGTVEVDAAVLAEVRNILDCLTYRELDCEDMADWDDDAEAREAVLAAVERHEMCYRCRSCQAVVMRDLIDMTLDEQGFDGGSRYEAYGKPDYDARAVWRDFVSASPQDYARAMTVTVNGRTAAEVLTPRPELVGLDGGWH